MSVIQQEVPMNSNPNPAQERRCNARRKLDRELLSRQQLKYLNADRRREIWRPEKEGERTGGRRQLDQVLRKMLATGVEKWRPVMKGRRRSDYMGDRALSNGWEIALE